MNLLFAESFEDLEIVGTSYSLPDGWTTIDNDGDDIGWKCFITEDIVPPDGTGIAYSISSETSPNVANYLISPQISFVGVTTGIQLKFYVSFESEIPSEHYYVKVSTTGRDIKDFTDVVYEEIPTKEFDTWHEITVDLSSYAGENIYLSWYHEQDEAYAILLDDITIYEYENTSLQAPANVRVSQTNGIVTLEWDRILKDTYLSYNIYSSEDLITWTLEESYVTDTTWSEPISQNKKFYRIVATDSQPTKRIKSVKTNFQR